MSSFTPVAIVLTGVGGAVCSYCISPIRENKSAVSSINALFKDKYRKALLDLEKDRNLWSGKWNSMKKGRPTHLLLQKSVGEQSYSGEAEKLHKEGCKDIYNSIIMATSYFSDFRHYCAKSNKDVIGSGWISENAEKKVKDKGSDKWDKKLKELQESNKQGLKGEL